MLQFRDIKQGYSIFLLDKQELTITSGKVTQVSFPRMEMNPKTGKTEMMLDITVETNSKQATYVVPDSSSVTCAANIVLATEKSGLISEVETIDNQADQILSSVEQAKRIKERTPALLADLKPEFREKQEINKRFDALEKKQESMLKMIEEFINEFKK